MKPYAHILHTVDRDFAKALETFRNDPLFARDDNLYTADDKERIARIWKDIVKPFLTLRRIIRILYWRSFFFFGSKNSFVVKYASIVTYYNMVHELRGVFGPHEEFIRQYLDDTFKENYNTLARYMYHVRFQSILTYPREFFLLLRDDVDVTLDPLFDRPLKSSEKIQQRAFFDFINIWYHFRYKVSTLLSWISRHGWMILSNIYFTRRDHWMIKRENVDELIPMMKPGDICITRRNWAATNLSIPGFWKHMSMYLGTWAFLKRYYPDSYNLNRLHDDAHYIIEAVWTWVRITTLYDLCGHNDYIGVLRTRFSQDKIQQAIHKTLGLVDIWYDFSFNYYSDVNYVCSALVTKAYLPESMKDEWIHVTLTRVGTGITYPPNDIVKKLIREKWTSNEELTFVGFIDFSEKKKLSMNSTEEAFMDTAKRSRLSLFLP